MNQRRPRDHKPVPMTLFDLIAQEKLGAEAGKKASRLFHTGELDDVSARNALQTLGCVEGQ